MALVTTTAAAARNAAALRPFGRLNGRLLELPLPDNSGRTIHIPPLCGDGHALSPYEHEPSPRLPVLSIDLRRCDGWSQAHPSRTSPPPFRIPLSQDRKSVV